MKLIRNFLCLLAVRLAPNQLHYQMQTLSSFLPANESINLKRKKQYQRLCDMLNENYLIPDGYCPFYFDQVTCWNATPSGTTVYTKCVSWQFSDPNPDGVVENHCEDGKWPRMKGTDFVLMYRECSRTTLDSAVEYGRTIAQIGYCASTISLLFSLAIYLYLRKLRCGRNRIHFNLFISLLLRSALSIVQFAYTSTNNWITDPATLNGWCQAITTLWNYACVSGYFWIFVEGLYLHNIIYIYVFKETSVYPYALFGWGAPLFICTAWAVTKYNFDTSSCWLANDEYYLILKIPLAVIVTLEMVIALNIARQLYYKLKSEVIFSGNEKYRKLATSTLYLIVSTGVTFFVFDVFMGTCNFFFSGSRISHAAYVTINSFWGLFVSVLYCFRSEEIRNDWKTKSQNRKISSTVNRKLKNPKSGCQHTTKGCLSWQFLKRRRQECSECKIRETLMELEIMGDNNAGGLDTQCSTVANSAQNTVNERNAAYPARVSQLSFCREENEYVSEL